MIYFDNAATTAVSAGVCDRADFVLRGCFGNPSSLYSLGFEAQKELDDARKTVAAAFGCKPDEIYFTASGTESNNLAVLGSARARKGWGSEIVITGYEHPSVNNSATALENEGFRVVKVKPDKSGYVAPHEIIAAVNKATALVALMHVNNETGAMLDVNAIAGEIKRVNKRTAVHCDNVQGFLKHTLSLNNLDTVSASGHKIHAPKGIGALYIRNGFHIEKVIFGGLQERAVRSGTENVAFAAALAEAIKEGKPNMKNSLENASALNEALRKGLDGIDGTVVNSPYNASPYILNVSFLGYRSETLLHYFEEKGIFVSSGSACSRGEKSHTLSAMRLSGERIDSAVRISLCDSNTLSEVGEFIAAARGIKSELVKAAR